MINDYNKMSDKDFDEKILELISSGKTYESPEVRNLLIAKALQKKYKTPSQHASHSDTIKTNATSSGYHVRKKPVQTAYTSQSTKTTKKTKTTNSNKKRTRSEDNINNYEYTESPNKKNSHFVIDTLTGDYTLLDSNYNIVATAHCNPVISFFKRRINRHKFKKKLKTDLKIYKSTCKYNNKKPNSNFIKMNRAMKFYLWLCPDADYNILELLRKNITKIDSRYPNYQTACHEYLKELAQLNNGDASNLGFDINLATVDGATSSNHSYISNILIRSKSTVSDYIKSHKPYSSSSQTKSTYSSNYNYNKNNYRNYNTNRNFHSNNDYVNYGDR